MNVTPEVQQCLDKLTSELQTLEHRHIADIAGMCLMQLFVEMAARVKVEPDAAGTQLKVLLSLTHIVPANVLNAAKDVLMAFNTMPSRMPDGSTKH